MKAKEVIEFGAMTAKETGRADVLDHIDFDKLVRGGIRSIDGDGEWLVDADMVASQRDIRAKQAQEAEAMQKAAAMADVMGRGADVVPKMAAANQAIPLLADSRMPGAGGQDEAPSDQWPQGSGAGRCAIRGG